MTLEWFHNAPGGWQATHWSNKAPSMWPLSLWQPRSGRFLWAQGSKQQNSQLQYPSILPAFAHAAFAKVRLASASHLVKHLSAVEKQTPLFNGRMSDIIRVWAWMQRREETFFFPHPHNSLLLQFTIPSPNPKVCLLLPPTYRRT